MSSLLKALVESSREFEFGEAQEVELKGLAGAQHVHQVRWHGWFSEGFSIRDVLGSGLQ